MIKPQVVFFDLDNTLFDHTRAERAALVELMQTHAELFGEITENEFLTCYDKQNKSLWKEMAAGKISADELKLQRFRLSLGEAKCSAETASVLSIAYLENYARQSFTLPEARETLTYLQPRYRLAILSNGFPAIQERKLQATQLGHFFEHKLYSADLGVMKPNPEIFHKAMARTAITASEAAYVGDSFEDDIKSAKAVGWQTIHFSPQENFQDSEVADWQITELAQLRNIF